MAVRENLGMPGIIPACAGNRQTKVGAGSKKEDHPRVCGE